jgi:hypothetical protein
MNNTTMVFIHGRGQEGQDPKKLTEEWRAGLADGISQAGLPALGDTAIVFPFYANALFQITAELARSGDPIELESMQEATADNVPFHPLVTTDVGELERQIVADLAKAAGGHQVVDESLLGGLQGVLSWPGAHDALEWVARHTHVDREVIKAFLKDVAVYLTRARDQVLDIVRAAVPADVPLVLVTHSLGTVVARDLLDDEDIRDRTRLWVTAGSPLALPAVQNNLRTKGAHNPGVPWVTAYDPQDIVALGHPLRPTWRDPLTDVEVRNGDQPHSITRYLSHGSVAGSIRAAVG